MKKNVYSTNILKVIIVLLLVNYMIFTIILNDNVIFKYLRDILLIILFLLTCNSKMRLGKKYDKYLIAIAFLFGSLAIAFVKTGSLSVGIVALRRYLFPLGLAYIMTNFKFIRDVLKFEKFLMYVFTVFSVWGIFQAFILKDDFLKKIGYPTVFLPAYGRQMLGNSFYFGNLGIQRFVSSLSNSNAAAAVLGMTLILLIFTYPYMKKTKGINICIFLIFIAYVATVSRANYLAMLIVVIMLLYKYIPHKDWIFIACCIGVIAILVLGVVQGESGIVSKLIGWVSNTIHGKETSSAGRPLIWAEGFRAVCNNWTGIGFGHVGTLATTHGGSGSYYACENSYLAMCLDMGIIGMISYLVIWLLGYKNARSLSKNKQLDQLSVRLVKARRAITIYFLIILFFSNHIYDMEVVCIFYVYIGLSSQRISGIKENADRERIICNR